MVSQTNETDLPCFDLDQLATPVFRLRPNMAIWFVNSQGCDAFRIPFARFTGAALTEFVPTPSHNRILSAVHALSPDAPSAMIEFPITDIEGVNHWANWQLKATFDAQGGMLDIVGIGRIITEELRHRNALEDLLRIANDPTRPYHDRARMIMNVGSKYFDAELAGVTRLDGDVARPFMLNFETSHINETVAIPRRSSYVDLVLRAGPTIAIHDMPKTEFAQYPFYENQPLGSSIASEIYTANRFYGIINFGTRNPRKQPFSEQQIQFCRLIAQWLGYTLEQQQLLHGLEASERKYRRIYESAPVMMAILDDEERLLGVNKAWSAKTGFTVADVVNRPFSDFHTLHSAPEEATQTSTSELRSIRKMNCKLETSAGKSIDVQISSLNIGEARLPTLAVMVDMTDRNHARENHTAINRELWRANEELKRFNTVAAHDLQEPLRKIRLFGDLLSKHLLDRHDAAHALEVIMHSAERLSRLVSDLLAFSRESERGYSREKINLDTCLKEAVGDLSLLIEETGAQIAMDPLPEVFGDAVPIQRLFYNLLINALKYRKRETSPIIRVFAREIASLGAEVVVRDNGIGLQPEQEEHIFEPFVRLQAVPASGSGIGLALCRAIATGHGWTIHAKNNAAGGTDFVIAIANRTSRAK